ncbi:hypothetical protein KC207_14225 [Phycicoccus sp. BSK3Z-2]|uniref:Uncharacterized protein n=1 Tax=Phycicoccus avicenniae TaxID=2828860 RepID=A0A941D9J7_9MICO|nr:hypothetical protein [Phycicoccus avicenniae]MBR7744448.1 hypothetical protein [Phycicoccus avicenniae]
MIANDRELTAVIYNLKDAHRRLGVPLPPKVLKGLDTVAATRSANMTAPTQDGLRAAVMNAVDAGRPLADDEAVRLAMTNRSLAAAGVDRFVASGLHERRQNVLRDGFPELMKVWAGIVDKAGQAITDAREAIPQFDFDRTDPTTLSASQAFHWAGARKATLDVEAVESVWLSLANALGLAYVARATRPLVLSVLTVDEIRALKGTNAVGVIKAGHPLQLADLDEFERRVAAFHAEQRQREAQARTFVDPQNFRGKRVVPA